MNSDYQRIADAIGYINANIQQQPSLDEIAAAINLSPFHFQRLFSRWAGVTPKKYLQILTVDRAKELLAASKPLLEVSDSIGLSSSSRLYDHFVQLEAVTPGEYKAQGAGINIQYDVAESPFGDIFIAVTPRGICALSFVSDGNIEPSLISLQKHWPKATMEKGSTATVKTVEAIFTGDRTIKALCLCMWQALTFKWLFGVRYYKLIRAVLKVMAKWLLLWAGPRHPGRWARRLVLIRWRFLFPVIGCCNRAVRLAAIYGVKPASTRFMLGNLLGMAR